MSDSRSVSSGGQVGQAGGGGGNDGQTPENEAEPAVTCSPLDRSTNAIAVSDDSSIYTATARSATQPDSDFANIDPGMTTAPPALDADPLEIRGFDPDMVVDGLSRNGLGALGPVWKSNLGDGTDVRVFGLTPREGFDADTLRAQVIDRLRELAVITHPSLAFPLGMTVMDGVVALVYRGVWSRSLSAILNGDDFLRRLGDPSIRLRPPGLDYFVKENPHYKVCCWGLIGSVDALAVDSTDRFIAPEMVGDDGRAEPTDATCVFTLAAICAKTWYYTTDRRRWRKRFNDVNIRPLLEACLSPNPDDRPDISTATLGMIAEATPEKKGWTAAHMACERNETDYLQGYLDGGGDVDAMTLGRYRPTTLLDVACKHGSLACVNILLHRGADLTVGRPLHWAARGGHVRVITKLINAGAVVEAGDFRDVTHASGFAALLDHFGGDPKAVAAAYVRGDEVTANCLALLIRRGADVALLDDSSSRRKAMIETAAALAVPGAHPLDLVVEPLLSVNRHTTRLANDHRSVIVSSNGSGSVGDADGGETTIRLPSWVHVFSSDDFVGEEHLGSGAYGEVTKRKLFGSTEVAVKVVKLPTTANGVQRFVWEVASHVMLSAHRNTVSLMGLMYDKANGKLGLVCELMDMDLAAWLSGNHFLRTRAFVLSSAANGLAFLHSKGLVHRDIKPANIFVSDRLPLPLTVKIGDFGLTSVVGGREGWTRSYAAPEVLLRDDVSTAASDAYSFGLVVYEVLAGVKAMPTAMERQGKEGDLPWVVNDNLPVPDGWWAMELRRALSSQSDDRPPVGDWVPVLEAIFKIKVVSCSRFLGLCLTKRWDEAMACNDGADMEGVNIGDNGSNALHYVAESTDAPLAMVAKCVEFGCDVNAISHAGSNAGPPLALVRTVEVAAELVTHGADVNATNDYMATPLMCAARNARVEVMRFLHSTGADLTAVDHMGRTVIDWAYTGATISSEDVILLLLEDGAVPGNLKKVLKRARRRRHRRVVARLGGDVDGGADGYSSHSSSGHLIMSSDTSISCSDSSFGSDISS